MFTLLGHAVRRGWFLFLLAWGLVLGFIWYIAPPWDEVAHDQEFAFLPKGSPSRVADEELAKAFPQARLASNVVLVLHRAGNEELHRKADLDFIDNFLEPGLHQIAESEGGLAYEIKPTNEPLFGPAPARPEPPPQRSIVGRILTPLTPGAGTLLVSPDNRAMLVAVELTTNFLAVKNWALLDKIESLLGDLKDKKEVPEGLQISVTGSAAIGRDHSMAELHSVRATGWITIVLVVALLILIYRAPLLAAIPLLTVYLAVEVAVHVLAIMGGHGYIRPFQGLQIYITILAYGAGVDYCLFLTARYKEELDAGASPADAAGNAVRDVGDALLASAATVIGGIAMMVFAHFGKFREAGVAIPIALALVLVASLTFSPALLRMAGRWAFWPHRIGQPGAMRDGRLQWIWDHVGQMLLRRPGTVWLATVGVMAPFVVIAAVCYNRVSYDLVGDLPASAPSLAGTRILEAHFPPGATGPATVLLVDPEADFTTPQGRGLVARLTDRLRDDRESLGLADVRSLTAPLGITEAAKHPTLIGITASEEERREAFRRQARRQYVTDMGGDRSIGTRLDLVLAHNPFSQTTIQDLDRAEQALRAAAPPQARLYFAGTTASIRDLAVAVQQDRQRIELLVVACVLAVLVLLLRRLVVSIYLLLSVLLSYFASLGFTFAVLWLIDPHGFAGIDWKVVVFLFTILIAVGEDYNIFLMSRISEECARHGKIRGIVVAVDRTGPIISSCGIIMAGTFGSLLGGSLADMRQLGFALAFGVLLDTFVVRPVLVPAFLILQESGRIPFLRWAKGPGACATAPDYREPAEVR